MTIGKVCVTIGMEAKMEKKFHLDKLYIADPLRFGDWRLFQIGRLFCTEETVIEKHPHLGWFELTVVTDGKGVVQTNDVSVPVSRGDIYFSFPFDFHGISSDRQFPLKYDFFSFQTDDPLLLKELNRIVEESFSADKRVVRDEKIAYLVGNAIAETESGDLYSSELLQAIFRQIIVYLIRDFGKIPAAHLTSSVTRAEELCFRLMNYIDTHLYTMKSLSELSEVTSYSYVYLSHLFTKVTSGKLSDYYRNRRIEAAKLLLNEGKLQVGEIAELLNFSNIYHFSRAFKDHCGVSPNRYRQMINEKPG